MRGRSADHNWVDSPEEATGLGWKKQIVVFGTHIYPSGQTGPYPLVGLQRMFPFYSRQTIAQFILRICGIVWMKTCIEERFLEVRYKAGSGYDSTGSIQGVYSRNVDFSALFTFAVWVSNPSRFCWDEAHGSRKDVSFCPYYRYGLSFCLDSAFYVGSGAVVYATLSGCLWRHKLVNIPQ